jgi:hypothetical protein
MTRRGQSSPSNHVLGLLRISLPYRLVTDNENDEFDSLNQEQGSKKPSEDDFVRFALQEFPP